MVKMALLWKSSTNLVPSQSKCSLNSSQKQKQFIWKCKSPHRAKAIMSYKRHHHSCSSYTTESLIDTAWNWRRHRLKQQTRKYSYSHLASYKDVEYTLEDSILNQRCWENGFDTKLDPYRSPHTKLSSEWIQDLSTRPGNRELQEQKAGSIPDTSIEVSKMAQKVSSADN